MFASGPLPPIPATACESYSASTFAHTRLATRTPFALPYPVPQALPAADSRYLVRGSRYDARNAATGPHVAKHHAGWSPTCASPPKPNQLWAPTWHRSDRGLTSAGSYTTWPGARPGCTPPSPLERPRQRLPPHSPRPHALHSLVPSARALPQTCQRRRAGPLCVSASSRPPRRTGRPRPLVRAGRQRHAAQGARRGQDGRKRGPRPRHHLGVQDRPLANGVCSLERRPVSVQGCSEGALATRQP